MEKKQRSGLGEFFSYFKPHMGLFLMDMACATLASVIDLAFPYVSRMSMTTLLPERMFTTFFVVIAGLCPQGRVLLLYHRPRPPHGRVRGGGHAPGGI